MTLLAWLLLLGRLSFPVGSLEDTMSPPKPRVQVQDNQASARKAIREQEDQTSPPKPRVREDQQTPPKP